MIESAPPRPPRLNSADFRFLAVCILLLAGGVWFSARYFHRAFPEASIDFRVTGAEARTVAQRFLSAGRLSTAGYREASRFAFDDEAKTFLERELGLERANELMGSRVRLWRWSWRWFRPQQKEEFRVDVTPRGAVAGFSHQIPEEAARPSLPAEGARAVAERFLRERMGRDPGELEFVEGAARTRPARTDHVFTWKERGFDLKGATYRVEVTVLGSEPGGYREYLKVPEAWLREYERLRSRNMAAQTFDSAATLVLVLGLLMTVVMRVRARDVRLRRAAVLGLIGGGLYFLSAINSHPLTEFGYPTTDSYGNFLARNLMQYAMGALASAGLLFVLAAAAEPLYREHFGRFVSLGNLFRPRGLRTKSFFKGTVLGLTLTGIFVAYQTGFYLVASRFGAWSPAEVPYSDMLNTRFPWLFVLFGGFLPAVSEEFLFRLFAIPWLRSVARSKWAAIVLAGFIWGFGHAAYPQQPFWIRGVEVGIGGVALGLILFRWGVLPALVWHYSVDALYTALLLVRSNNTYFVLSGAASAGVMLLPVAAALFWYWRRGGFEPETELTNAFEGTATAPAEQEAAAPAPPADYQPWPVRRRFAALAVGAAGFALLLAPAERFGDQPRFALTKDEARAAADGFLRERGISPDGFRAAVFPSSSEESGDWMPADTARYMLERRPVSDVSGAFARLAPPRAWSVRYYRPLEHEEVRVSVHPATGKAIHFRHILPEDRPGADVSAEAARAIAGEYLAARGFDMAAFELKETTTEAKKARRDHTLVWEARPGDARNLGEARYRVRVEVAGDRASAMRAYWKLPEPFVRARAERNALSTALALLRAGVLSGTIVLALVLLVQFTRKRELRWRRAILLALPATAAGVLASVSNLPLMMRAYSTAVPLETFRAVMIAGVGMGAVGVFLAMAGASGLLLALRGGALEALRAPGRRASAGDALCAVALASGLTAGVVQFGHIIRSRLHALALFSVEVPTEAGAAVPALSLIGSAVQDAVYSLAVAALVAWAMRWTAARKRWAVWAGGAVAAVVFVSGQVHTLPELALEYAVVLAGIGAVLVFAWFARRNWLAWVLASWTLAAGERALSLLVEPAPALRAQGWVVLAVWAATIVWAAWPVLRGGAAEEEKAVTAG